MGGGLTGEQVFQAVAIVMALLSGVTWLYASTIRVEAWRLPGNNGDWDMPRITSALTLQSRWNARAATMSALAVMIGLPDWMLVGKQIEFAGGVAAVLAAALKAF